jgi:hypothetical protein
VLWIRIRFNADKIVKFYVKKKLIYLSLSLHEGGSSYRSLQPSKESKEIIASLIFLSSFCPPGSESAFPMRIRIQPTKNNADLDSNTGFWREKNYAEITAYCALCVMENDELIFAYQSLSLLALSLRGPGEQRLFLSYTVLRRRKHVNDGPNLPE